MTGNRKAMVIMLSNPYVQLRISYVILLALLNFDATVSYIPARAKDGDGITLIDASNTARLVSNLVDSCCVIAALPNASIASKAILTEAKETFKGESSVCFVQLSGAVASIDYSLDTTGLGYFARRQRDLSCLHPMPKILPKMETVTGVFTSSQLVDFVNSYCGTYLNLKGELNAAGQKREELLAKLYDVPQTGDEETGTVEECERIDVPSRSDFFDNYMSISKPVIIKNALRNWTAISKWSNTFFYEHFGARKVHVKLSPDGEFEGCESDTAWDGHKERHMPAHVRQQMDFPDLVVVRPATTDVPFSAFMDHITSRQRPNKSLSKIARQGNASAYLEYTSIPNYMPELEDDISPMPFLPSGVRREHLNLWLSDGNTLGKLHFDPYDNILAQIDGEKELTLFSPHHNERLYEGYIPEAILGFSSESGAFSRTRLLESMALVMSPVDIKKPDFNRFPLFKKARPMKCRLTPGDALFMPAFWWHEVQSRPGPATKRNLAVNFWYTPFFTKEFPCATCKLNVNPAMRHILEDNL